MYAMNIHEMVRRDGMIGLRLRFPHLDHGAFLDVAISEDCYADVPAREAFLTRAVDRWKSDHPEYR